jgi:hypothetical protein
VPKVWRERKVVTDFTTCIEGFFEVDKDIENVIKSTNFISKKLYLKKCN